MYDNARLKEIEDIIRNPVYAVMIHDPEPFEINPELSYEGPKIGRPLMRPTGKAEHSITMSHGVEGPNDPPKFLYRVHHTGFWSVVTQTTLYFPDTFREVVPVWTFSLSGQFSTDIIERRDLGTAKTFFNTVMPDAHRQRFALKRAGDQTIHFRAPNYTKDSWTYSSLWNGDWKDCRGSEVATLHGKDIWRADFVARLIVPIS